MEQFLENLQGRFDIPDRMFFSVATAWQNVLTSPSDVKQLIPEFFYMPEFLRNANGYDLGVKQDGEHLNEVRCLDFGVTAAELHKPMKCCGRAAGACYCGRAAAFFILRQSRRYRG